jgi:endoglucanase
MNRIKKSLIVFLILLSGIHKVNAQGYLHCKGKYIYDGSGNEVILRGIGTGNWMLQEGYMMQTSEIAGTQHEFRNKLIQTIGVEKTDSFYNEWLSSHVRKIDIDSLKAWGFNSVRAAMHYKWFTPPIEDEPVPGEITWNNKGFILIDSLLTWCSENEMYLILDLHGAPGGQGKESNISDYDPSKPSLWESQANKDKTVALWRKLAERYSSEPWIGGYDLINETNWTFPEGNNSKLRELMVNITNAIREVDQNHIIFVEGNSFANDFSGLTPPWDDNMAYSFHKYWNYNTQQSLSFAINLRNTYNIPIWLGETGENSNVWYTSLIELCEKNRIGWAWWPVKKPGINNPLKVTVNNDYTQLINYWKGTSAHPGTDAAFESVLQFARNHRLENCTYQKDVVDAMIRQPYTTETIPFKLYKPGEPVFAVDYNLGRNNYAYFDSDTANFHGSTGSFTNWNQGWSYRNDGVDIEPCSDNDASNGFNVGWTEDGEWLEYTLKVDTAAGYALDIRSASGSGGAKVHMEVNDVRITPDINLPGTSGWQNWKTTSAPGILLPEGIHKVKLVFSKGGSNINYFKFSKPVPASSLSFTSLGAETSDDGRTIILTLNKTVTSDVNQVNPLGFLVLINNEPVKITGVSRDENSSHRIILELEEPLYYGAAINLSWQGNSIQSYDQQLDPFTNLNVLNQLPVRFNLPGRIQAEDFSLNRGMVQEACSDAGGGYNMGYANPGDYLDYRVAVAEAGYYDISFRIATIRPSSKFIIRIGEEESFAAIDTVEIKSTGGWQSWKTISTTAFLPEGRYTLRIFILSGEFNINWFQTLKSQYTSISVPNKNMFKLYPNPTREYLIIESLSSYQSSGVIRIFNNQGQPVQVFNNRLLSHIEINVSDFVPGIYFLEIETGTQIINKTKIIVY